MTPSACTVQHVQSENPLPHPPSHIGIHALRDTRLFHLPKQNLLVWGTGFFLPVGAGCTKQMNEVIGLRSLCSEWWGLVALRGALSHCLLLLLLFFLFFGDVCSVLFTEVPALCCTVWVHTLGFGPPPVAAVDRSGTSLLAGPRIPLAWWRGCLTWNVPCR